MLGVRFVQAEVDCGVAGVSTRYGASAARQRAAFGSWDALQVLYLTEVLQMPGKLHPEFSNVPGCLEQ